MAIGTLAPALPAIAGITELNIRRYFNAMNDGDYASVADLFAETGAMHPPFEAPVTGRAAIARYLGREALGMRLIPREGVEALLEDGTYQAMVEGSVQALGFRVNVRWKFAANRDRALTFAQIELVASPQELLGLRQQHKG